MTKPLIILCGLAISAVLTGCASSTSIQDQVLLIQYEKCLDYEREVWIAQSKEWSASMIQNLKESVKKSDKTFLDYTLDECAKYLP